MKNNYDFKTSPRERRSNSFSLVIRPQFQKDREFDSELFIDVKDVNVTNSESASLASPMPLQPRSPTVMEQNESEEYDSP
jgi:hypothetical protein